MAQAATLNMSIFSDNSQFAFDDDPTNIEFPEEEFHKDNQSATNITKPHKSVNKLSHMSMGGSSLRDEAELHKTRMSSSRVADIHDTLQKIANDIHITGFESSVVVTGLKNARVYTQLAELPWRADFRATRGTIKRCDPASGSQRHHSSKVESIERQRAGSGPGFGEPIVSGSSSRPTRKLVDDVERPLRQDSFSANEAAARRQKEPRPTSAATTEGDDEVFYKENNPHDTNYCPYVHRHPSDPHGARKLGVSSYAYLYQSTHPHSYGNDTNEIIRRMKQWNTYGRRLQRRSEKDRRAAYEELEKQDIVDYCVRKHQPPSTCSLFTTKRTCRFTLTPAPSCTVDVAAELSDPTPLAAGRRSPVRRHPKRSASATAAERKPFTAVSSNKSNHVTFSVPANKQTLMNLVKNNYPTFTSMMKELLAKPKGECLTAEFEKEMNRHVKLLDHRLTRIQGSVVNATGERREKLKKDLLDTNRDLHLHEHLLEKLAKEMDGHDNGSDDERPDSPAQRRHPVGQRPQHDPRELNALRVLQRVFGSAN